MAVTHIAGKNMGAVMLYALSTCGWCRKTKMLLGDLGAEYDYIDVDLLIGAERDNVIKTVEKWNPDCSFPTLVINNNKCIAGFKADEIRAVLKK